MKLNLKKIEDNYSNLNDTSREVLRNLIQTVLSCNEKYYFNASASVQIAFETLIDMGIIETDNLEKPTNIQLNS